jgi:ABC-type multidrug transport system ATPase subunit
MEILQRLNREEGMTVIIVTHEPEVASYAARMLLMRDGELVGDGSPAEIGMAWSVPGRIAAPGPTIPPVPHQTEGDPEVEALVGFR